MAEPIVHARLSASKRDRACMGARRLRNPSLRAVSARETQRFWPHLRLSVVYRRVMLHKIWFRDLWTHVPLAMLGNRHRKSAKERVRTRVDSHIRTCDKVSERLGKRVRACGRVYIRSRRGAYRSSYAFPRRLFSVQLSSSSLPARNQRCVMHSKIHRRSLASIHETSDVPS